MSLIPFTPAAVLLDMDGLLLDSERALLECWREASRRTAIEVEDAFWLSMVGLHERVCDEMLVERLGEADAEAMREACYALYSERVEAGLPLKSGVCELVDLLEARGVPRAIVTSTRRERALQKLEAVGLRHRFDTIVTGSDIAHPKPAPDIYLLAADRLGVAPGCCVVIEDSLPGVQAALAAGMTPIQVPDLVAPDADARALGHRIVESLVQARALIEPALASR
jgi:HAD superfamily hydrolase (TIGR01509 family)